MIRIDLTCQQCVCSLCASSSPQRHAHVKFSFDFLKRLLSSSSLLMYTHYCEGKGSSLSLGVTFLKKWSVLSKMILILKGALFNGQKYLLFILNG